MLKLYIISGETSGDIHGANLIRSLKKLAPKIEIRAWGGVHIESTGVYLAKNIAKTNFMGFSEVISNLPSIISLFRFAKKDIIEYRPDAVILIDYPGFNLRLAKWLKSKNIPVIYYISPQIWAWKSGRIHLIKDCINLMISILPFEVDFYKKYNYHVEYVGHPLLDEIENIPIIKDNLNPNKILAILPGSRIQEVQKMLPTMISASRNFPTYNPIIVKAPTIPLQFYRKLLARNEYRFVSQEGSINILRKSTLAIVSSGTATLETALLNVPQVVCYKGTYLSYQIAKRLVKLPFISLVNLIMQKQTIKELIQNDFTVPNLTAALKDAELNAEKMKAQYTILRQLLGQKGASQRAAEKILAFLSK